MMSSSTCSEETPLLASDAAAKRDLLYRRFSPAQKRVIVALVSWCGLFPLFVFGTFIPSIPQISRDLETTGDIISLSISISIFGGFLGAIMGASYSTIYGRRLTYLFSLPVLCGGSFGVGLSRNVLELMISRFIQALGAAPGMSVGAGVIGDIYRLEERGQAVGIYFAAVLLGPALSPPVGGFAAEFLSWRILQYGLGIAGFAAYLLILAFMPETIHPGSRSIDSLERNKASSGCGLILINPLKPLALLRSPNLFCVSFAGFLVLLADFTLGVPLAYTIGARYGISNPVILGLCFVPSGIGKIIGAPLAGHLSDRVIISWREKRGGVWYPEDRLRATYLSSAILVPFSTLFSGLLTACVPTSLGLGLNFVCLFVNGAGVDMVLTPAAAYVVDVMHHRSAESMAANNGLRSLLLAFAVAWILPLINTIGVARTNAIAAILSLFGSALFSLVIRYGNEMRAWADVGYSIAESD